MRSQILRVIESSLSAAIAIDERSFIVGWSAGAEKIFGWLRDKIVGRLLSSTLVPPGLRAAHERGFERYRQTGEGRVIDQVIEVPALHRDGSEFPIRLAITPAARSGPQRAEQDQDFAETSKSAAKSVAYSRIATKPR